MSGIFFVPPFTLVIRPAEQIDLSNRIIPNTITFPPSLGKVELSLFPKKNGGQNEIELRVLDSGLKGTSVDLNYILDRFHQIIGECSVYIFQLPNKK